MKPCILTLAFALSFLATGCLMAQRAPIPSEKAGRPSRVNPRERLKAEVVKVENGFELRRSHDSLYWLNDWQLPYPVYQFQTGDVDGDGRVDAMVGVVKSTRFFPEKARRLFIFKQVEDSRKPGTMLARPLWMGSKLGGILEDFRYCDGGIRALESTTDSLYVVSDYKWGGFGMSFEHFIIKGTDRETAEKYLNQTVITSDLSGHREIFPSVTDPPDGLE